MRFIAVNNGIDSEKPDTLEFAPFINIMSEWYAKDISKKVKTGIKTKGMSGKPIATEAPYGYVKDPDNKDFWIIDEEAAEVVRLIFRLFIGGKNRNQIAVYLKNEQMPPMPRPLSLTALPYGTVWSFTRKPGTPSLPERLTQHSP